MLLNGSESYLQTGDSEGLTLVGANGEFSIGAIQRTKNQTTSGLNRAKLLSRSDGELFRLRPAGSCRKPEVFTHRYKAIVKSHVEY